MAGPYTVTATLNTTGSAVLQGNAFVRFRLRNFAGFVPRIAGTAVVAETQIDAFPDINGLISQLVWGNTDITPSTTFYTIEFWDSGRITSSGNYLINANTNLGTAAQLNTPPVPPGFSLALENNGTLNSSQNILNLVTDDGSVTITDLGTGNIRLRAKGGASAGSNLVFIQDQSNSVGFNGGSNDDIVLRIPASAVAAMGSTLQVSIKVMPSSTALTFLNSVVRRTLPGDTVFTDTTNLTWSGSTTPTFSSAGGRFTSDRISVAIDGLHDTYIILVIAPGSFSASVANFNASLSALSGEIFGATAYDTIGTIPNLSTLLAALGSRSLLISQVTL